MSLTTTQKYSQSINIANSFPFNSDYFMCSNPDPNGNYQTITYRVGGAGGVIVRIINVTYDAQNNVTSAVQS